MKTISKSNIVINFNVYFSEVINYVFAQMCEYFFYPIRLFKEKYCLIEFGY